MKMLQFCQLVLVKVGFNLRSEASTSYLNYVWWILEPVSYVGVFYVVFAQLLHTGQTGYVTFLVCGQVPFQWYSRSVLNSSTSIMEGRELIDRVRISKVFFPLVVILQDFVKHSLVLALMLLFLVVCGISVTTTWLFLPLIVLTQMLFILASGLIVASIVPIVPDFKHIISTGMMLLMFGSGVFYRSEDVIDPRYHSLFFSNPMAALIREYRQVLLGDSLPDLGRLLAISVTCLCIIAVTAVFLERHNTTYSRLVHQ